MILNLFADVVSALVHTTSDELRPEHSPALYSSRKNDATTFVLREHAQMPDFLRLPLLWLTLLFDASGLPFFGRCFRHLSPERKRALLSLWRYAWFSPCRDLVRFYDSLISLAAFDDSISPPPSRAPQDPEPKGAPPTRCEVLVVGSGPGGAVTAATLAEAGRNVLLVEEGSNFTDPIPPFSAAEMALKYRNGGLTPALGTTKVAYVEGRCVGGGSEINSGLYHRTPPEILEEWRQKYGAEISEAEMQPHFEACERDLSVSYLPTAAPAASLKLHEGAGRLGWKSLEVPRWFSYTGGTDQACAPVGMRQTMSKTYIPRALAAGCQLLAGTKVVRLRSESGRWRARCVGSNGEEFEVEAETVFLGSGAIQSPFLLRRSGITANIGDQLQLHPTVKAVALFPETINHEDLGVPVHQVKEFSPLISLGCSISTRPYLALGMIDNPRARTEVLEQWERAGSYYGMIKPQGRGAIRALPGFQDPLVRFRLTMDDRRSLATALRRLTQALLSAQATAVFPGVGHGERITSERALRRLPAEIGESALGVMTIHLFSSCPMGEKREVCAADSFGRVHGFPNLYICDASLLPTAPGVNPQGSVMSLARRNALHFLNNR